MNNTKAERFRRVGGLRVQKVLDSIDNLAKCSNRSNYEYTEADVRKMMRAIKARVKELERRFGNQSDGDKIGAFSF